LFQVDPLSVDLYSDPEVPAKSFPDELIARDCTTMSLPKPEFIDDQLSPSSVDRLSHS
jgi:hypothetical protein